MRTGHIALCRDRGGWGDYAGGNAPGLAFETAEWLHHQIFLAAMGLPIGEIFDLEELAADCANDSVYEFFFAAPPLPITGAVGSPVNPLAIR